MMTHAGTVSMTLIVDAPKISAEADSSVWAADASITRAVAYSRSLAAADTPSVHVKADSIAFVENAPMARAGAVSVNGDV